MTLASSPGASALVRTTSKRGFLTGGGVGAAATGDSWLPLPAALGRADFFLDADGVLGVRAVDLLVPRAAATAAARGAATGGRRSLAVVHTLAGPASSSLST